MIVSMYMWLRRSKKLDKEFHIGPFSFMHPFCRNDCGTSFGFCRLGPHCSQGLFFLQCEQKTELNTTELQTVKQIQPWIKSSDGVWNLKA